MFKALRTFEEELKPVFEAEPDNPWETPMQQYTSLGVREKMIALYREGVKPIEIARQVGRSPQTVYKLDLKQA